MEMKKYKIIRKDKKVINGIVVYRIQNLRTGVKGGYIASEKNLSQEGYAWVGGNAIVYGNARVYDNAKVYGSARVYGNAKIYEYAEVDGHARVYGHAEVFGTAQVFNHAKVYGHAWVSGNLWISGNAKIYGDAIIPIPFNIQIEISKGFPHIVIDSPEKATKLLEVLDTFNVVR